MATIFPWQQLEWQQVKKNYFNQQMPHALLLTGLKGMGKTHFAVSLAELLLCRQPQPEGARCNDCTACKLLRAGCHPDLLQIKPATDDKEIRVEQIRHLINELSTTPRQGNYQVVILEPAEALNTYAANALLKTLEEPPGKVVFILVSHQPQLLIATIRSRCQTLTFKTPTKNISAIWLAEQLPEKKHSISELLALAEGVPLKALSLAQGKYFLERQQLLKQFIQLQQKQLQLSQLATNLLQAEVEIVLTELMKIGIDVLWVKNQVPLQLQAQSEYTAILQQLSLNWLLPKLFNFLDKGLTLQKMRKEGINLNWQLALEDFLSYV